MQNITLRTTTTENQQRRVLGGAKENRKKELWKLLSTSLTNSKSKNIHPSYRIFENVYLWWTLSHSLPFYREDPGTDRSTR